MHSAIVENTSSSVYLYMYVCVGEYFISFKHSSKILPNEQLLIISCFLPGTPVFNFYTCRYIQSLQTHFCLIQFLVSSKPKKNLLTVSLV